MKKGIHPEYKKAKVTCACGNVWETMSTKENISVELCSACHPFYTGKQKLVDTQGRVDKFEERKRKAAELASSKKPKNVKTESDFSEATTDEEVIANDVPEEKIEAIEEELESNTVELNQLPSESDNQLTSEENNSGEVAEDLIEEKATEAETESEEKSDSASEEASTDK